MFRFPLAALVLFLTINLAAQDDIRSKIEAELPRTSYEATPTPPASSLMPAGPTTAIEFVEETHDFGTVTEGEIVTHVFTFTNTGDEPLIITNARGSCGCTVPEYPVRPIRPGETASLTVEFNSRNKFGNRNQKVTITANTEPRQTFLYLTGYISRSLEEDMSIDAELETPEEESSLDCFLIYPNPTADQLKIEVTEENLGQTASVSIYSRTGQLMAERRVEAIRGPIEFEVAHYPAGDYVAQVQIGNRPPESRCFLVSR